MIIVNKLCGQIQANTSVPVLIKEVLSQETSLQLPIKSAGSQPIKTESREVLEMP